MEMLRRTRKHRHVAVSSFRSRAVRTLPYEVRLRNYEREKEELFYRIANMTPDEIHEAQLKLIRKWQV